jgi:tetratricopeptide (TPR) repeat protein
MRRLSDESPVHRDLLYAVLGSGLATMPYAEATQPFAVQVLVGTTVSEARADVSGNPGTRLGEAIAAAQRVLAAPGLQDDPRVRGELLYLVGQAQLAAGDRPAAVAGLTAMAEQMPDHDRADAAIRQAVGLAGRDLQALDGAGSPQARAAFVRAAGQLRRRVGNGPASADLTFAIAVVQENDRRFVEAAGEYAAVPDNHLKSRDAALGRLRCWHAALDQYTPSSSAPAGAERLRSLAVQARSAIAEVRGRHAALAGGTRAAATAPVAGDCGDALLLVALAELLNHPALGSASEAVDVLADFETRFMHCPTLVGPALRQRIAGFQQTRKFTEARDVAVRFLAADPDHAGPVMAGLLQSMQDEIRGDLDRGDDAAAALNAKQAVQLGRQLLDWEAEQPGRLTPADRTVIRQWHAAALLQAGRPGDALELFDKLGRERAATIPAGSAAPDARAVPEIELGRADALAALGRTAEALAAYSRIWASLPEGSENWWRALAGSLECHGRLDSDPGEVLQSIRQQEFVSPDLGGGRWKHRLERLKASLTRSAGTRPASSSPG